MDKKRMVQKGFLVLFCLVFLVGVILAENTTGVLQDYVHMIWASVSLFIIVIYLFLAVCETYIRYDYYSMRSYVTDLNINTCRDYIQHKNIYDTLQYTLEEVEESRFIITFTFQIVRGHSYVSQVINCVKYQVNLYELNAGTEITCMFIPNGWFKKAILPWYIDRFIEQKFNAKKREISYVIQQEDKNGSMV